MNRIHLRYPLIEMIYFDAGGGHRASALALKSVVEHQQRPWMLRLVNLRDLLEPADFINHLTGVRAENFYNALLRFDLTFGIGPLLPILHILIRMMHTRIVALLAQHWNSNQPDLVVSVIPHFNRAIFDSLRAAKSPGSRPAPMVTIMTDLADYPPHFWIEPQEQYIVCGTSIAVDQALEVGLSPK